MREQKNVDDETSKCGHPEIRTMHKMLWFARLPEIRALMRTLIFLIKAQDAESTVKSYRWLPIKCPI